MLLSVGASPAAATCETTHQNIEAYAQNNMHTGNRGGIFINNMNYGDLNDSIHRSLFIWSTSSNNMEIGWTAHNGGHSNPTPYKEWWIYGTDSGVKFIDKALLTNDTYNFRVVLTDIVLDEYIFYIDSDQEGVSPATSFYHGWNLTNSERRNTCDTWYAHFQNLKKCNLGGPNGACDAWDYWGDLQCYVMSSGHAGWYVDKISDHEHYVDQSSGQVC